MVMNPSSQPVIQLAEMQPASQFQLPALPALIGIQSAYADTSFTFNDNLVNDCEQFGAGVDNENCDYICGCADRPWDTRSTNRHFKLV